ncbi:MAG TPA: Lrp/AsnC family transcriptional regulator [Candidatus Saccharimonadales bacterium]|nr:Lrp/AsnC family transcriptional regulator [Candidatus Saccharimonadales bacterium]
MPKNIETLSPVPKKISKNDTIVLNDDSTQTAKSINPEKKYSVKSNSQKRLRKNQVSRISGKIDKESNAINIDRKPVKEQFSIDRINLKIIDELISNGDIKSSEISEKLKIPLSTIQRRRTRIEKSILKKKYQMDLTQLGYRTAQIFVDIQKGKAKETGEELIKKYNRNIVSASTRINSSNNLCLEVVYNGSDELHYLLEEIKSIPLADKVDWSEQVMMIGDNMSSIIKNTLTDRLKQLQSANL